MNFTKQYYPFLLLFLPCLFLNASSTLHNSQFPLLNEQNGGINNHPYSGRKMNELANNSTVILAAEKTYRRDPLAGFDYYTGGWDYRSMHYWASLGFSAAPLFIIAVVWFLAFVFGFCIAFICCCCCCRRRGQPKKAQCYSRTAHKTSLMFLMLFTIASICGCVVLYVNQAKFSISVAYVLEFILKKGLSIFDNLMNVMTSLSSAAANNTMDRFRLPPELINNIRVVDQLIQSTASVPKFQSLATSQNIQLVLRPAGLALEVIAAVMLVLAFFGFLFSILGLRFCVYMLAILGWILVTMAFILCGVFLVFHNAVADTCLAMEEWLENPRGNSPLSLQLLPCMDKKTAEETLNTSRATTFYLIDVSNRYINQVANQQVPPVAGPLYHNQSGPLVPLLCNPYNPDFTNRICAPAEVNISDASLELKKYKCEVSGFDICETVGRLTPDAYEQITSSVNTFNEISEDYCPNLRDYSLRTYAGMLTIACSVMFSVILWIVYGRERQHMLKYKKFRQSHSHDSFAQGGNWK